MSTAAGPTAGTSAGAVLGRHVELALAAAGVVLFFVVLLLVGAAVVEPRDHGLPPQTAAILGDTWPGELEGCVTEDAVPNCYREPVVTDAIVKQPQSTYSAFALSAAGLWILLLLGRERSRGVTGPNPMVTDPFYKGALGLVGVLMGPGAILFHATLTKWGGVFDQLSMYLLLGFMAAYNTVRTTRPRPDRAVFGAVFAVIVVVGFIVAALSGDAAIYLFIASAILVAAFEVLTFALFLPKTGMHRDPVRFWFGAVLTLAIALAVWIAGNPDIGGGPTDFPFHLIWHVTSAAFLVAYFYYLRSEAPPSR